MRTIRFALIPLFAIGVAAACGTSGDESATSFSDLAGTTASSGGAGGSATASSSSAASSVSTGGAAPVGKGPPYPVVLAHGFFGFTTFAGLDFETYFYNVKAALAKEGETVYTPAVDPFNDSDYRGAQLAVAIKGILAQTGYAKVNIIGHSQGGLDARVVAFDYPDLVASVTTIATPHQGTPIADVALKLIADPTEAAVVDSLAKLFGGALYDTTGSTTSLIKPLVLFSQAGIAAFNAKYPDVPSIPYYSIAGRSNLALATDECKPDMAVPFTADATTLDPLNALFVALQPVMAGSSIPSYPNDGLIRVTSARRGVFLGCVPADHLDEIGQILGESPGIGNSWKYQELYSDLIKLLRTLGY